MNRLVLTLWMVVLSMALAACSSSGKGEGCLIDSDCLGGMVCQSESCVLPSDGGGDGGQDGNQDDGGEDDGGSDAGDTAGDEDDGGSDAGGDTGGDQNVDPQCAALTAGRNDGFMVDGIDRGFILHLPNGIASSTNWPVVFNYHGLGDSAQNQSRLLSGQVDNQNYPFILVTPDDTAHTISAFGQSYIMDWDVFQANEQNKEVRLFDELLKCLDQRYGIDSDRIHVVGFSMGGLLTDMMATMRGEVLASVASYSGGYWANPNNRNMYINIVAAYPEYNVSNRYTQLFIHGGPSDTFDMSLFVIQFDQYAASDLVMLNDRGNDAIICNHSGGHSLPQGLLGPELVEFFADHPKGSNPSPWASSGLPGSFPAYCTFESGN